MLVPTQARHLDLIMPSGVGGLREGECCLEMAGMPGSPLAASPGEGNDSTMQSPGLGCCDIPVAVLRPGFLGESRANLRLSFISSTELGHNCNSLGVCVGMEGGM